MTQHNSCIRSMIKYIKSWIKITKIEDQKKIWLKLLCVFGENYIEELDLKSLHPYDRDMMRVIFSLCRKVYK
ncbi:MAG: hypothetical protein SFT68_04855 [Rickettsiaceae bacterium]|nr:hypothetical protein [Rickettsiaceae bacterium]